MLRIIKNHLVIFEVLRYYFLPFPPLTLATMPDGLFGPRLIWRENGGGSTQN